MADGFYALFANSTGNNNAVSGYDALYSNTTGSWNTANADKRPEPSAFTGFYVGTGK